MTMLLDGRLRDLATQTHLLETKVSSLGWMAGAGAQTLKSMTRAQAHLMLAECVRRRNGYQSRRAKARRDAARVLLNKWLDKQMEVDDEWLDDLYRIVGKGDVRDSDFILNGESFYCPQCGRHLKAATGTVKGSEEKRYRFKCVDRMHYRTKWHESYQAALMEMIKTFEKGENA